MAPPIFFTRVRKNVNGKELGRILAGREAERAAKSAEVLAGAGLGGRLCASLQARVWRRKETKELAEETEGWHGPGANRRDMDSF